MSDTADVINSKTAKLGGRFLQRAFSPSVTRMFYLLVFSITMFLSIFHGVSGYICSLFMGISLTQNPFLQTAGDVFYLLVVLACCFAFFLHMLRLYISVEELEDPFSPLHQRFICKLTDDQKRCEQILRSILFLIVSAKLFELTVQNELLPSLSAFAAYSFLLYLVMSVWDYQMTRAGIPLLDTFAAISFPGVVFSAIIFIFSFGIEFENARAIVLGVGALYLGLLAYSLGLIFKRHTDNPSLKETFNDLKKQFQSIWKRPYCGFKCDVNESIVCADPCYGNAAGSAPQRSTGEDDSN